MPALVLTGGCFCGNVEVRESPLRGAWRHLDVFAAVFTKG